MIFGEETDWKEFLCQNAGVELAEIIERSKQHRCAYSQADDIKIAQVWCGLTEVSRQMKQIRDRVDRMEAVVRSIAELGEIARREAIATRVSDILKPKTSEERQKIDKVVESLMRF